MVCRKFVFDGRFFLPDSNGDESVCPTTFPPIEQGTGRSSSFLSTPAFSPNPDKRLHANPLTSQPASHPPFSNHGCLPIVHQSIGENPVQLQFIHSQSTNLPSSSVPLAINQVIGRSLYRRVNRSIHPALMK